MHEPKPIQVPFRWPIAGLALGTALATALNWSNFFDDAYIHARLAENWVHGGSPAFNTGMKVKTDSSTGYLLIVALFTHWIPAINAIRCIEAAVIPALTVSLFYLVGSFRTHLITRTGVALAILPFMLVAAYGGMETPVVCLLLSLATIGWRYGKHAMVLFLLALAIWFRLEAILLFVLTLMYYLQKELPVVKIVFGIIPLLALFALEFVLFGTVIPHAAQVKASAYNFPISASVFRAISLNGGVSSFMLGLILTSVLIARLSMIALERRLMFSDSFMIFSLGILVVWMLSRSLLFPWYFCLLVFPLGLAVILSAEHSTGQTGGYAHLTRFAVLLGLGLVGSGHLLPSFGIFGNDTNELRTYHYLNIARGLYRLCPSCTLVTSEIGAIGYGFKGVVFDGFGLGDPEAGRFHPLKVPEERNSYATGAIPPKYVQYRKPDFIVSMPLFTKALRASSILSPYYRYDCPFEQKIGKVWGDTGIELYSTSHLDAGTLSTMGCLAGG